MGGQAVRIGWGSTFAAAQDALLVLDLNADGSRGAGGGRIDQAKEVVLSLWGDAGRAQRSAVANVLLAKFVNGTKDDLIGWDLAVDVG
jgi:hypothetical protein